MKKLLTIGGGSIVLALVIGTAASLQAQSGDRVWIAKMVEVALDTAPKRSAFLDPALTLHGLASAAGVQSWDCTKREEQDPVTGVSQIVWSCKTEDEIEAAALPDEEAWAWSIKNPGRTPPADIRVWSDPTNCTGQCLIDLDVATELAAGLGLDELARGLVRRTPGAVVFRYWELKTDDLPAWRVELNAGRVARPVGVVE